MPNLTLGGMGKCKKRCMIFVKLSHILKGFKSYKHVPNLANISYCKQELWPKKVVTGSLEMANKRPLLTTSRYQRN